MKLTQREIDLLRFILEQKDGLKIANIRQRLGLSDNQIRYTLGKINRFLRTRKVSLLKVEKDCILIGDRERILEEFTFFVSHTTPGQFKFTPQQMEYFILLKLLIADDYIPINYFTKVLGSSRTSIVNLLEKVKKRCAIEAIQLDYVLRRGYRVPEYSFKRFAFFVSILKKLINIREIYSFYYKDTVYSKVGDLVFFDIFELDLLFEALEKTIEYSKTVDDQLDDTSFLNMMILNYKLIRVQKELPDLTQSERMEQLTQFLSSLEMNHEQKADDLQLAQDLLVYLETKITSSLRLVTSRHTTEVLIGHLQRFIVRQKQGTPIQDVNLDFVKMYPELFHLILTALRSYKGQIFQYVTASEAALVTLYYINGLDELPVVEPFCPRILIICAEGRAISSILKGRIAYFVEEAYIDTIAVFEFQPKQIQDYDYIMTTIKLPEVESEKVIYIENAFSDVFLQQIQKLLTAQVRLAPSRDVTKLSYIMEVLAEELGDHIQMDRIEAKIINILATNVVEKPSLPSPDFLFDPTMLVYHQEHEKLEWREAVQLSSECLLENGSIEASYIRKMIYNIEQFGLYMVIAPGVMLIHAGAEDGVRQNGLSMHVFQEPVIFPSIDGMPIQVIIVVAMDKHSSYLVIESLIHWITQEETLFTLRDSSNRLKCIQKINTLLGKNEGRR
ncbi:MULTISPECIES: BglG family transcription antiterminator [unclassified Streptococcus]|uniref:BglG family transcription antiterminator n=1 Tax=unclassified Streptococcus TaxID=2608887 RepID=UPI00211B4B52|nr:MULTISPECIES: PTS sugar transporter subunit IIA [unclassified Streptococcus]MCQ9211770.1 PTS sugar transporter subunit IIA [Streptococcus sp. B01]MCQ9213041.1 PTS sugar transporter subunit IIA [Streptococcus sp. O1]